MRYEFKRKRWDDLEYRTDPEMYREILDLVARIDPMDLVRVAGEDEYSLEAKDILVNWVFCRSRAELKILFQEVFDHWFGLPMYSRSNKLETAPDRWYRELWNKLLENRLRKVRLAKALKSRRPKDEK